MRKSLLISGLAALVLSSAGYPATYTGTCTFDDSSGQLSGSLATGGGGGGGDTTAPTVSVTAPTSGATVSGTVTLTATATDNVAVQSVQFKVDGANRGSADTSSPYTKTWDTTGVSDGTHTITAVATDTSSNQTTSAVVTVTVQNQVGGSTSTDGTTIPPATQIVDDGGHIWTVADGDGHTNSVYRDGTFTNGWNAQLVLWYSSHVYHEDNSSPANWYEWNGSDWDVVSGDPRGGGGGGGGGSPSCLDTLHDDMTLAQDAPTNDPYDHDALVESGNNPPSWASALTGWGAALHTTSESNDSNTAIEVKDFQVYYQRNGGTWQQLNSTTGVGYQGYTENWSGTHSLGNCKTSSDGGTQCVIPHGVVYHFWPTGSNIVSINTSGITGIYVTFKARLVLDNANGTDDRSQAQYVAQAGGDYYQNTSGSGQCCGSDGGEIGYGRYKYITNDYQTFGFTSVSASQIQSSTIPVECPN